MRINICFAALTVCAVTLMGTGCKNEVEDYFDKSSAERVNEAVAAYSQVAASSPGGWVMEYYPTNSLSYPVGSGYLIMADIKSDGSVSMAMNNDMSDGVFVSDTSMWEVIKDYGPVLSFSTYNNCLHSFCDPAIYDTGLGLEGDYEFLIINMEKDAPNAMLKGKKRGVYVRMSRVPAGTDYEAYLDDIINFQDSILPADAVNYNLMRVGNSLFKVEEINGGIPNIYPYDGDPIADESWHPFLITKLDGRYHLRFRDAMEVDGTEVQEFVYDEKAGVFAGLDNDSVALTGPDPVAYFADAMSETNKHVWVWNLDENSMSADLFEKFDAINKEGSKLKDKYSVKSVQYSSIVKSDAGTTLSLDMTFVTSKKKTATVSYLFDLEVGADAVTLANPVPKDETAANVMKNLPSIAAFLETVQDSYMIRGAYTNFSMNDLVLNSEIGKMMNVRYSAK